MDKVIIVNAFSFIGFSLANLLLDKGIEVVGLVVQGQQDDHDLERKLLFIGRNSNFTYYHENDEFTGKIDNVDVLYYCVNHLIDSRGFDYSKTMQIGKTNNSKVIFISSLDIFDDMSGVIDEKVSPIAMVNNIYNEEEKRFMAIANELNHPFTLIRVPTLYGPWQPDDMVYQQYINNKLMLKKTKIVENENTNDILFIDDVTIALFTAGLLDIQNEIIHLTSGKKNEWQEGVQLLAEGKDNYHLEERESSVSFKNEKAKRILKFQPIIDLKQGIEKQINHSNAMKKFFG